MLPLPTVVALLCAVFALNQVQLASAVAAATNQGLLFGGAAGAAVGAAAACPRTFLNVLGQVISLLVRVLNSPFWFLAGGREAARRIQALEATNANLAEVQEGFIQELRNRSLNVDALRISLNENYINSVRDQLRTHGANINFPNPIDPSLFSFCEITDAYGHTY